MALAAATTTVESLLKYQRQVYDWYIMYIEGYNCLKRVQNVYKIIQFRLNDYLSIILNQLSSSSTFNGLSSTFIWLTFAWLRVTNTKLKALTLTVIR